ncbi:MAG: nucleotidyltransferase domain-containing protein [Myxococcales bacterium]|nr:nucleotidyltransferase domain-containing protein [Myxococcales bacterium]
MALKDPQILGLTLTPAQRSALAEYVGRLKQHFGPRLERAVLFGSRARGDAGEESDIDVLVLLRSDEQAVGADRNAVWELLSALWRERGFEPIAPVVMTTAQYKELIRRERRFPKDLDAEGIVL